MGGYTRRVARHHPAAPTASAAGWSCFSWKFLIAALIASSANTEQWTFTGGSDSSSTIDVFLIAIASSTVLPLSHSVARLLDAIAEPHPNVLNRASSISP